MDLNVNGSWAMDEFSDVDLGDERLNDRLIRIADRLSESPESPINQACADWAETKAAYRFFRNDNVDAQEIISAHSLKTVARAREHKVILALQDTSYLVYTKHPKTKGLGKISMKEGKNVKRIYSSGLIMHTSLATTTNGLPLGILDQKIFARELREKETQRIKDTTPIEEKESYRWLESLQSSTVGLEDTQVVTVCDREADMYEFFKFSNELKQPVLVRANTNRTVNKRCMYQEIGLTTLWEHISKQPTAGSYDLEIPAKSKTKHSKERESRVASLEVKFGSFKLNPTKRLSRELPDIDMHAVYVFEPEPPEGVEPIEWMLLTNLEITDFEQAYEKVQWYTHRWRIEMFHKVLKSGLRVEDCRLGDAERLIRYLTIMSIVAWRLFAITLIARTDPDLPCSKLLAEEEWKVLYLRVNKNKKLPKKIPKVGEVIIWIARLGGFLARKNDGYPGTLTLWRGWKRLTDLTDGWMLARQL